MSEGDTNYLKALEKSRIHHSEPEGLSRHIPSSVTDKTLLKQNNTIIELLIDLHRKIDCLIKNKEIVTTPKEPELPELHKKIDILIKEKETQEKQNPISEIEELVNQLKKIEITPQNERKKILRLNSFKLYILNKEEILVRTDCETIVKFHQKINDKNSSRRRWLNFTDTISIYKNIVFEHIKGKENALADQLSRLQLGINK